MEKIGQLEGEIPFIPFAKKISPSFSWPSSFHHMAFRRLFPSALSFTRRFFFAQE